MARVIKSRDLSTATLDSAGNEELDPIPFAATIGVNHDDSLDVKIRKMIRAAEIARNPDLGLDDLDDVEDVDDELYPFERLHNEIETHREAMQAAEKEMNEAKAAYKEKLKADRLVELQKAPIMEQPVVKVRKAKKTVPEEGGPDLE